MKLISKLFVAAALLAVATLAQAEIPFNILSQDTAIVTDIRAEGQDVWIKLAPAVNDQQVTVRISDKNRDFYRPWFTGSVDLVSTGFRGNNVWSDRVQTKAQYIEYWLNDTLVLHLERK